MKIAFFSAKEYEIEFFNKHNTDQHQISYFKDALNDKTVHFAKDHDIVCIFVSDIVSHTVMEALEKYNIGLIALRCAGFDNVCFLDEPHPCLTKCAHLIKVVNVPTYSPHAVAEFTVGLMLSMNRKIHRTYYKTKSQDFRLEHMSGFDMQGKTVGIIGLGSIGKIVAHILKGFQMHVLVY